MQTVTHLLTTAEAIALVKKVDRTNNGKFCVHIRVDAPLVDNPERIFSGGCFTYLNISRKDALHMVTNMLTPALEARGGRIKIDEFSYSTGDKPTYWIG